MKYTVSKEEIQQYFHLPLEDASKKLGVCASVLKRSCRQHGIKRWPYRKIKSIDKKASSLESVAKNMLDQYEQLKNQIANLEKRKKILIVRSANGYDDDDLDKYEDDDDDNNSCSNNNNNNNGHNNSDDDDEDEDDDVRVSDEETGDGNELSTPVDLEKKNSSPVAPLHTPALYNSNYDMPPPPQRPTISYQQHYPYPPQLALTTRTSPVTGSRYFTGRNQNNSVAYSRVAHSPYSHNQQQQYPTSSSLSSHLEHHQGLAGSTSSSNAIPGIASLLAAANGSVVRRSSVAQPQPYPYHETHDGHHFRGNSSSNDNATPNVRAADTLYRPFTSFLATIQSRVCLTDSVGMLLWYSDSLAKELPQAFSPENLGTIVITGNPKIAHNISRISDLYLNQYRVIDIKLEIPRGAYTIVLHAHGIRLDEDRDTPLDLMTNANVWNAHGAPQQNYLANKKKAGKGYAWFMSTEIVYNKHTEVLPSHDWQQTEVTEEYLDLEVCAVQE